MTKFFYFLILICLIFFSQQQQNYINEYFNKPSSEKSPVSDECLCNTNYDSCNYLCCCDEKCSQDTINQWRERSKCIDEKDTVGIFSDRCIEQNLIVFYNKRRGLKKEEATEDISNSNKMIKNYCFSMDNSKTMSRDIETVNFVTPESMSDNSQTNEQSESQDYLTNNNEGPFFNNGHFSLYSGIDCNNFREVGKFENANFTCSMNSELNTEIRSAINGNNIRINGKQCTRNNVYNLQDRLLNYNRESNIDLGNDDYIVEIEFIIQMTNYDASDLTCSINLIKTTITAINGNKIQFKNSVIFSNNDKVPYRYSGTNGYLNGYPLKILSERENLIFNEYYIAGRDRSGNCRTTTDDDINNYLYYDDKPFLFNQDYIYSCILGGNSFEQTILYQRLINIKRIAKYGDVNYKQITDDNYGISVTNNINLESTGNTHIKMNIYLGTKKIGVHSFKYIYKVILKNIKGEEGTLTLDIKYIDLDKTSEHEEKPNYPTFIPSMPADLLDPIIYSQVDK